MQMLFDFNRCLSGVLEGFLESAVPLIASVAEIVGLVIIVVSLAKATYHYLRVVFCHDKHDYQHEMSSGLTTALEFLMSAEVAKTFLLPSLESVIPLAATIGLRAMMSLLLHIEMRGAHNPHSAAAKASAAKEPPADAEKGD